MSPFYSIITVTYNSAKTIESTILALLSQEFLNFEYIIIDGGSSDSTIAIVNDYLYKFKVKKINVIIISEPDFGIYDAMNKGIYLANGKWIGIINSDDYYNFDALFNVFNFIEKNINLDVVYGDMNVVDLNGLFVRSARSRDLNQLPYTMPIFHPTIFIRKDVYLKHGLYSLKYKLSSDWELLKRYYNSNLIFGYIDYSLSNFRIGGSGSGFKLIHFLERVKIRHRPFKFIHLFFTLKDFLILLMFKFSLSNYFSRTS